MSAKSKKSGAKGSNQQKGTAQAKQAQAKQAQSNVRGPQTANQKSEPQQFTTIPTAIRAGGAFVAMAIVLFIFTLIELITKGFMVPFEVTPRFLMIIGAAIILGAFGMASPGQRRTPFQVAALALAVLMVLGGRFIPNPTLTVMEQYWLPAYGILAMLCGLILRRTAAR